MLKKTTAPSRPASASGTGQSRVSVTCAIDDLAEHSPFATDEAIRLCAYQKWEAAGKPADDGLRFWLEAERQLSNPK